MFLANGFKANEPVLVVARPKNWKAIANHLEQAGCSVAEAVSTGLLTVCDADRTMARFMRNGQPVAELFQTVVGSLVERLAASTGGTVWIYGEMVDVLAEERNFTAARYLEELWNEIGLRHSITLLCGYSSAHFADPTTQHMLAQICDRHTHVDVGDEDVMGNWVLKKKTGNGHGRHELPPTALRVDA